jgi:hypothetical protein
VYFGSYLVIYDMKTRIPEVIPFRSRRRRASVKIPPFKLALHTPGYTLCAKIPMPAIKEETTNPPDPPLGKSEGKAPNLERGISISLREGKKPFFIRPPQMARLMLHLKHFWLDFFCLRFR